MIFPAYNVTKDQKKVCPYCFFFAIRLCSDWQNTSWCKSVWVFSSLCLKPFEQKCCYKMKVASFFFVATKGITKLEIPFLFFSHCDVMIRQKLTSQRVNAKNNNCLKNAKICTHEVWSKGCTILINVRALSCFATESNTLTYFQIVSS